MPESGRRTHERADEADAKEAAAMLVQTLDPNWRRATWRNIIEVGTDVGRRKWRLVTAEPETVPQYSFVGLSLAARRAPNTQVAADPVIAPGAGTAR